MTFISDDTEIMYCGKDMEEAYQMGKADTIDEILDLFGSEDWEVSAKEVIKAYKEQKNESFKFMRWNELRIYGFRKGGDIY